MRRDHWAMAGALRLHAVETGSAGEGATPLLVVQGLSAGAEDDLDLMEALAPRQCVSFSFRGRGRSEAPRHGYTLGDHVNDIEAVVETTALGRFCVYAYSRGVSYALGYAARHADRLAGMVLGDYPAHHTELPPEWVDWIWSTEFRGIPLSERMPRHALEAVQRESAYVPLSEGLRSLSCPVLVLRGGREGSLLPAGEADRYRRVIPDARVVVFENSGHELWNPDFGRYAGAIRSFLEEIDHPADVGRNGRR